MKTIRGRLSIVATPIGNLGDLSPRAMDTLRGASLVAAEDTRHSAPLLAGAGVHARTISLHEHNEAGRIATILATLAAGGDVALVSDAGTPLVSDPGFRLVRAVRDSGFEVTPIPGPCAAIAALCAAGLPSDRFVFEGFLPARAAARRARLAELAGDPRTLILYESPHRLAETLADAAVEFGAARHAVLARELTKVHETFIAASLGELAQRVAADPDQRRGECVLLLAGCAAEDADPLAAEGRRVYTLLCAELPPARAARLAAAITGAPRRALYGNALAEDEPGDDEPD